MTKGITKEKAQFTHNGLPKSWQVTISVFPKVREVTPQIQGPP